MASVDPARNFATDPGTRTERTRSPCAVAAAPTTAAFSCTDTKFLADGRWLRTTQGARYARLRLYARQLSAVWSRPSVWTCQQSDASGPRAWLQATPPCRAQ